MNTFENAHLNSNPGPPFHISKYAPENELCNWFIDLISHCLFLLHKM